MFHVEHSSHPRSPSTPPVRIDLSMEAARIRNFAIIAHIDPGKSTHADRMLYPAQDGQTYQLNLIDTPGHVDFSYEVSRSLAACEGALLVVDASQGVEAQTLANTYLALDHHLDIVPIINKIDLPGAEVDRVREQLHSIIGMDPEDAVLISAKYGKGVEEVLEAIVKRVPAPKGDPEAPLKALLFDSWFDVYRGVLILIRVIDGEIHNGMKIRLMSNNQVYQVDSVGVLNPKMKEVDRISAGEVGYVVANIKVVADTKIGDTITEHDRPTASAFPGFQEIKPMVFAGLYPVEPNQYEGLRDALEKLRLNDSSFFYEPETSTALGFGFRCGFLGLLHMEIIQERLEREFQLSLITTAPSVRYRITHTDGKVQEIDNPTKFPEAQFISQIEEPIITALIMSTDEFVGAILKLVEEKRGLQKGFEYVAPGRVLFTYEMPLNENVLDFYDRLKSVSKGYASFDYHLAGYRAADLVRLDILVSGEPVDALSWIVHRDFSYARGKALVEKMKELIPRQMFEVAIQAAIGNRVIARETIPAIRKNVLAKCYGGDITRKRKLLEKQKEGKRRMKRVGKVDIPQEAFLAVLKVGEGS